MSDGVVRVLLVEDAPDDAQVIREALAGSKDVRFELEWADRLTTGLARLEQGGFDLILTDLSMPDAEGLDSVTKLRAKASAIPLVVLTSQDDGALATRALQQGAQDYLVKGYIQVYPDLLLRALQYAIERNRMQQRERELLDALTQASVADRRHAIELDQAYGELKRAQAMLVQAEKMAAVGQLASGIAHEVKNPLNILLQSLAFLEPELRARGGQPAEILGVMREAVTTADRIIRGMLDFSKPSPLELKPTPVSTVVEAALRLVQSQCAAKKLQVATEIAPALPPVLMDANQMQQVFVNLFMNAIQATPAGGELRVRARLKQMAREDEGVGSRATDAFHPGDAAVVCDVQDTGAGIPKDVLSQVGNPFFTTKPPGEGVGLGLSISLAIVQGHRGLLRIASDAGKGTTVTVTLPVAASTAREAGHG
jgi:signal transduction histidine kinase